MCWTDFPPGAPPSEVLSIWRVTGKPFRFRCKLLWCFFLFYVLVFNTFVLLALYVCFHIFSSPEPKAHRGAYSIPMLRRPSSSVVVRRPSFTISKIFSSETTWPIKAKLRVEHP